MPWRPHTHTWNETERYGKSEWGDQVEGVWEYPCGNGSSHWFPGPWWPKAQTQAAHFPSNIVLELIDTGWVHITAIILNLRYPRETEELKWMRLVELEDPMERYPRCWLGFKGSPSFSPGFSSRGRRQKGRRDERVWEQTSQYYISGPRGFSDGQTQKCPGGGGEGKVSAELNSSVS